MGSCCQAHQGVGHHHAHFKHRKAGRHHAESGGQCRRCHGPLSRALAHLDLGLVQAHASGFVQLGVAHPQGPGHHGHPYHKRHQGCHGHHGHHGHEGHQGHQGHHGHVPQGCHREGEGYGGHPGHAGHLLPHYGRCFSVPQPGDGNGGRGGGEVDAGPRHLHGLGHGHKGHGHGHGRRGHGHGRHGHGCGHRQEVGNVRIEEVPVEVAGAGGRDSGGAETQFQGLLLA